MKLRDLLAQLNITSLAEEEITDIVEDSREASSGKLFIAITGSKQNGAQFIEDALARGATAALTEQMPPHCSAPERVILIQDARRARAAASLALFPGMPKKIVAVTGTNGKSSVVHYVYELCRLLGKDVARIGTLGVECTRPDAVPMVKSYTTLPAPMVHRVLDALARGGVEHVALEASSQGLHQHRMDAVKICAAGFTNLSHDHLDYHGTMEAYFEAKMALFTRLLPVGGIAVLNRDIPEYDVLEKACKDRGITTWDYGTTAKMLTLKALHYPNGQVVATVRYREKDYELPLMILGDFQVMNLLCAVGLVHGMGERVEDLLPLLPRITMPMGRSELVRTLENGARILVDYAHSPDALAHVLQSTRLMTRGKLHVVFGCGGDRDPAKRPVMGKIAAELADHVVITDDNPRTEDPQNIRQQIEAGAQEIPKSQRAAIEVIGDRKQAIAHAICSLADHDILVIAGKGHEQGQIIGTETHPMSDHQLVTETYLPPLA